MLKNLLKAQISQANPEQEMERQINKAIKISKMPSTVRTTDEIDFFVNQLSKFSFFENKVPDEHLGDVLRNATIYIRYTKVKAGTFLSHIGQYPDSIYLVAKGEAWRFREKTEEELKLEGVAKKKKQDMGEKILETFRLAAAHQTRDNLIHIKDQQKLKDAFSAASSGSRSRRSSKMSKVSISLKPSKKNTGATNTRRNSRIALFEDSDDSCNSSFISDDDSEPSTPGSPGNNEDAKSSNTNNLLFSLAIPQKNSQFGALSRSNSIFSPAEKRIPDSPFKIDFNKNKDLKDDSNNHKIDYLLPPPHPDEDDVLNASFSSKKSLKNKFRDTVKQKIQTNLGIINFENDYLLPILKQDPELTSRYIYDNNPIIKFEKRYIKFHAIGEISLSLSDVRNYAIFAYTDLHIWSIDLKAYEQIFATQIEEVQDKMKFFVDNFTKMNQATLRRACFLFEEVCYPLGEIVFREGAASEGLYFIKSGEVHVKKKI